MAELRDYIDVPYEEKDDAKALGAKWDVAARRWYIPVGLEREHFKRWMRSVDDENGSYFFVVVGHRTCWKCHRDTSVVALGIPYGELLPMDDAEEDLYPLCDPERCDSLALLPRINSMPKELRDFLEDKYCYEPRYSKTTGLFQLNNCCDHCGALEGEFFDFEEPDGPFFITDEPDLEQLTFYKVEIPGRIYGAVGTYSRFDGLALRYANEHAKPLKLGIFEDLFI